MSDLKELLKIVIERMETLESEPSNLVKDAALADLRNLYDAVRATTIKIPKEAPVEETIEALIEEVIEVVAAEPIMEVVPETPEPTPEPIAEPAPEPIAERTPQPEPEPIAERTPEPTPEPVVEQKVMEEPIMKQPNIADETFEPNADKDILAGKLNRPPLQDLNSGIPLNEKFGIIQNLFSGSASDFGDAVQKINNSTSAEEMSHYLNLLKQRLGWNEESESYVSFTGYVERRMLAVVPSNANSDQQ